MSFPASRPCASAFDASSRYLNRRDPSEKCLLQFSDEFLDPSDGISEWYRIQPYKRFRTIRYYKEQTGVKHEFILLLLQGEEHGDVVSHCRLERMGDPEHLFQTVFIDGTIAEDYIHAILLDNPKSAELTGNSELVLEITFPITFDIRDALAICYGISKHRKAKRYTLMQYNCYFFSWTVIIELARACLGLGDDSSLRHLLRRIRTDVTDSINTQGSARFHSIAYLLSNATSITPESGEDHPLDQAVKSRIDSIGFSNSITKALSDTLWLDKLRAQIITNIFEEIGRLARGSVCLLDHEEVQDKSTETSDAEGASNPSLQHAVCTVAEAAAEIIAKTVVQRWYRCMEPVFLDRSLVKQRLGRKAWYKLWRRSHINCFNLAPHHVGKKPEPSSSPLSQIVGSPMREWLLIPPSFILSVCSRVVITSIVGVGISVVQARAKYEAGRRPENNNDILRKAAFIGSATKHAIFQTVKFWPYSKIIEHRIIMKYASEQGLVSDASEFFGIILDNEEADLAMLGGLSQALEFSSDRLREVKVDDEFRFSELRQSLLTILRNVMDSCLLGSDITLLDAWTAILWERFLNMMVDVVHRALEGFFETPNPGPTFSVVKADSHSEPSHVAIQPVKIESRGEVIKGTRPSGSKPYQIEGINLKTRNVIVHEADVWSYKQLQEFIRGKVSQLSRRETEFAYFLRHIPLPKSPEVSQRQIEVTMEEIWRTCWPLMPMTFTRAQFVNGHMGQE